jgi:hypothetical protein
MSLNLQSGGDFTPHIRYMASTASWKMSAEGGPVDFSFDKLAVFDLEQIQTGWCAIAEGVAPEWVMDESLSVPAPKPNGDREWKRGFRFNIFSKAMFGDEPVREFGTSGTGACKGVEALYAEYESGLAANKGKVPVVKFAGAVPTKIGKGNTNIPTLELTKWADRPGDLPIEEAAPVTQPATTAAPTENNNIDGDEEF